ncbi:MAG: protein kinase [Actinomycetota bacterium]|nr:protein kinase [Actinomycetota bacterium]
MQQKLLDSRYGISGLLGSGGMAKVYLAHDEVLGRDVALKVLREQYAENDEFVERFRREAQAAASLSHPNIVATYDRGRSEDGSYYIVMEYVPGGTLKDRILRDGPMDPDRAARVAAQIASALDAAHERGVIHRDVKPQNVLLTASGDAKVADFGIARAASESSLSGTSVILGTVSYMSPEQVMGKVAGPRSDLYSLGVVLHEMLTGRVPFEAENPMAVSMKHVNELAPPWGIGTSGFPRA